MTSAILTTDPYTVITMCCNTCAKAKAAYQVCMARLRDAPADQSLSRICVQCKLLLTSYKMSAKTVFQQVVPDGKDLDVSYTDTALSGMMC